MGLISTEVEVNWNSANKKWYENKGYVYTKIGEEFKVKVEDLSNGSKSKVDCRCDNINCKNPILKNIIWQNYLRCVKEDGKYYCNKCAMPLYTSESIRLTKLNNGISFEKWCIKNNRVDVLNRWDYVLNDCKPNEISYTSNKKYYLKCQQGIHNSELKNITSFTSGKQEGSIKCLQCNSFQQWCLENNRQDILELWDYELNDISPLDISYGSNEKIYFKCPKGAHSSELKSITTITGNIKNYIKCKTCNSFAQWGIDNLGEDFLEKYWDYDKNININPWKISRCFAKKKVYIKCQENITHDSYPTLTGNFTVLDNRCPRCTNYKGEKEIYNILINVNKVNKDGLILYKTFQELRGLGNGLLSYDIYLLKYNYLIEFQGIQHEKPIDFNGRGVEHANREFQKQVEHDRRKKEYALNNGYNFLEIWYWEIDKIEEILEGEIFSKQI